jgi:glycosyltransferase involved in cell wall biosynthesis
MDKKIISIVVPVYNESNNLNVLYTSIKDLFAQRLPKYNFELLLVNDSSTDNTQDIIYELHNQDKRVKAICNFGNYGPDISSFYGLINSTGACAIRIDADLQYPIDIIPEFISHWEKGEKVVVGVRRNSASSPIYAFFSKLFYFLLKRSSGGNSISGFTGFGLYDRSILDKLKVAQDTIPSMKTALMEYRIQPHIIEFKQLKSINTKSKMKFWTNYDWAMLFLTSSTKTVIRLIMILGILATLVGFVSGVIVIVMKLLHPNTYEAGIPTLIVMLALLGGAVLLFLAVIAEYIYTISRRLLFINRGPLIEAQRIGFK